MNLLDLPDCMLEEIFSYLSFDEIAKKRLITTRIDKICQGLLNRGFYKMMKRHGAFLKSIKTQLPRRESERRNHPLSKHVDILTCIETRISMLSMTYSKYIELKLCCFIPGKVIDEVIRVLNFVETTLKPLRTHEVLQELRDISSMAIEHFDEKISHALKRHLDIQVSKQNYSQNTVYTSTSPNILISPANISAFFPCQKSSTSTPPHICPESKKNASAIAQMKRKYRSAVNLIQWLSRIQKKQSQLSKNYAVKINELSTQILELKRRLEESDAKSREAKLTSNIKPRMATIILKRRITEPSRSHHNMSSSSASSGQSPTKKVKVSDEAADKE